MRLFTAHRAGTLVAALMLSITVPAAAETPRVATIDMSGTGSTAAAPDMAMVQSGVVTIAETAAEALSANTAAMTDIVARIRESGVEPRDIQTSGFSVSPQYRRIKPNDHSDHSDHSTEIVAYRVSNTVHVRIRDLERLGTLLDAIVRDGANSIDGLSFAVSDAETRKDNARKAAIADAMRKAQLYAEATGVELGRVLSIREQSHGPRPKMMMMARAEMADAAAPVPVEAGEATLQVNVDVTWEIEQE